MTRDELWELLLSRNQAMKKPVVSLKQAEFRRFFELVWREAQKDASMTDDPGPDSGCSGGPSVEDLARMMGEKHE